MLNYYHILGVPSTATQAEIKSAYKQLAKRHHPDISKDNGDKFKQISAAYTTLSNPSKRRQYDLKLQYAINQYKQRYQKTNHATHQNTAPKGKATTKKRRKVTKEEKEKDRRMTIQLYVICFVVFLGIGVGGIYFDKWMKGFTYDNKIEEATTYFEAGNTLMALTRIQEARDANADHYKSYELEGDVYNELFKNYKKAKRLYQTAIKRANNAAPIQLKMGKLHSKYNEYQRAINTFRELTKADTLVDSAKFYLGKIYIDNVKSYSKGLNYLSMINLSKENAHYTEYYRLTGDAYFLQKDFHEAQRAYSTLLDVSPASGRAYYYRGLSYLGLKDTLQSCNDFEKAVSLGQTQAKQQFTEICTE